MHRKILCIIAIMAFVVFTAGQSHAAGLPDTGQTKCYDNNAEITCPQPGEAFYGQDAEYAKTRSYTDLGNGIVRDNVTGLEWVQDGNLMATRDPDFDNDVYDESPESFEEAHDGRVTWQHALDYVALLNAEEYLGYDDWRLPSIKELASLLDSSRKEPAIDPIFGAVPMINGYWSSTPFATDLGCAWAVDFTNGYVEFDRDPTGTGTLYVRAVRGNPLPANNFINNGDGTITDTATGLMWQQDTDVNTSYHWQGALAYCEDLDLAGHTDWRMPDKNELLSIVDYSRFSRDYPSIDPIFSAWHAHYWTSTTILSDSPSDAWVVVFSYGGVYEYGKASGTYVRAVRGGQYVLSGDLGHLCIEDYHCDEGVACEEGVCEECVTDEDCDDGLFCTGVETCVDQSCVAAANPCEAGETCNEDIDACIPECEIDDDCDDGLFCTGVETCVDQSCVAATNPCISQDLFCNEDVDQCVECFDNNECPTGTECSNGACVAMSCTESWQCPNGFGCAGDVCVAEAPPVITAGPFLAAGSWPTLRTSAATAFTLTRNYAVLWAFEDDYGTCSGLCTNRAKYRRTDGTQWFELQATADETGKWYAMVELPVDNMRDGTYVFQIEVVDCAGQIRSSKYRYFKVAHPQ
jgi:hypothetical protein